MMGVFVKSMKMPQKCGQCNLYHAEYPMYCMAVEGHRTVSAPYEMPRPDWCPLVEVPESHNDLVDREWVRDSINHSCWLEYNDYLEAIGIIDDAPTIIEAEDKG